MKWLVVPYIFAVFFLVWWFSRRCALIHDGPFTTTYTKNYEAVHECQTCHRRWCPARGETP